MRLPFKYLIFCFAVLFPLSGFAEDAAKPILQILDMSNPDTEQNTGVWIHNIMDPEQGLKREITSDGKGQMKLMRLEYDVDSPNPAMAGFWVNLRNQDLRGFDTLHISLKADGDSFPGNIAFQFTDADYHKAAYIVSRVPTEWKVFEVPLRNFKRINDWAEIREFEIIIDDINARPKEGVLFINEIYVSKKH